jgi:DNA polymerase-3 subunit alpha
MLCKGDVSGIFQINNQAGKVMEQQPRCFRDLIAINALIRPGVGDWSEYIARRNGKEYSIHPIREKYYRETQGILAYQEQFMADCVYFAGWEWAYADKKIRKNKNIKADAETKQQFISDCLVRGHEEDFVLQMWKEFEDATGDYSFCKAHAASYAQTAFKTAFLKCYYPEYFYASMMTSEGDDRNAISAYVAECKSRGIKINPPSINSSNESFTVGNGGINYRITTIRDVGDSAILGINALRPIHSFDDFLARREKSSIKQNVIVNLIKAGTFDEFGESRDYLMWKLDMSNRNKTAIKNNVQCPIYVFDDKVKAEWEKDALGMYLSVHPMERFGFKPFDSYPNGETCLVGGEVSDFRTHVDKNGKTMAFGTLDTLFGSIRITVFATTYARLQVKEDFAMGKLVMIKGKKDGDNVLLNSVEVLT